MMAEKPARSTATHLLRWAPAIVLLIVAGVTILLTSRRRPQRWPDPVRPATAMGDSTCLSCHTDKGSYEGTAHRLTSRHPSAGSIAGSFRSGENLLRTPNPDVHFRMHADSTGFYQTAVMGQAPDTTTRTERITYVAGSNRKGQSFLYMHGDTMYQMPVSYWKSLDRWINSPGPGYADGRVNFDRPVAPRCFECHATWIEPKVDLRLVNRFDTTGAILGITCERCHATGREHVEGQRSVLKATKGMAIVNPARLTRERQMEACAQCHGGLGSPKAPAFSYVAGKRLSDYLFLRPSGSDTTVDVHGNQVALLAKSRCFQASQMTCVTCHDVHRTQRDVKELSGKCLSCHTVQSHKPLPERNAALAGRCVDCHMPLKQSNLIVSALEGGQERALVRTHWIRVYQDSLSR